MGVEYCYGMVLSEIFPICFFNVFHLFLGDGSKFFFVGSLGGLAAGEYEKLLFFMKYYYIKSIFVKSAYFDLAQSYQ
jgi:hypothetical protein